MGISNLVLAPSLIHSKQAWIRWQRNKASVKFKFNQRQSILVGQLIWKSGKIHNSQVAGQINSFWFLFIIVYQVPRVSFKMQGV
jgi:hypothetical protein